MNPKRLFYVLCGLLLAAIGGGGFAYYASSQHFNAGVAKLSQRLSESQAADTNLTKLADLQKQYKQLGPYLPLINESLPAEKNQSKVALQLQNIATASGMRIDNIDFPASSQPGPISQTVPIGDVLALQVTFQLVGNYDQLQDFLRRQERLDRYSSMTSLNIGPAEAGRLSFSIILNVFVKP
ncbi:MAG TPA: type 4a pilus biogenesis protein PilO [Candidatus Saccharimonadia bacterium]